MCRESREGPPALLEGAHQKLPWPVPPGRVVVVVEKLLDVRGRRRALGWGQEARADGCAPGRHLVIAPLEDGSSGSNPRW